MRILLVAMSDSIHTARWISQIADQRWDIHLFPSVDWGLVHPEIKNVTVYHSLYGSSKNIDGSVKLQGLPVFSKIGAFGGIRFFKIIWPNYRIHQLMKIIDRIKPDIIHSMEIQAAGYLTSEVKKRSLIKFPTWIVTNWGSDIYLFGRFPDHKQKIKSVLAECDYYTCECMRDVKLAQEFGFKGRIIGVFPNTCGYHLEQIDHLRQSGPISKRRIIMLKGYQHWAGRALIGLKALEYCSDILEKYEVVIYSASRKTAKAAKLFHKKTGIRTRIIPKGAPHNKIMRLHGQARISLGLSISDGISTALLEAVVMGSFPIQSWTACADEWIEDGKTGILVPPEDPEVVAKAIRRALTEDDLVNYAGESNYRIAAKRLDQSLLKSKVIDIYTTAAQERGIR